jgi:hypothetical protein
MRVFVLAALVFVATAQSVAALTIRDIIELSRSGLKDDVLLALIEVDGGVYATDTDTLKSLKEAGVSDRVMVALIRSGREKREQPAPVSVVAEEAPNQPPQVVVIDHRDAAPQQVVVPVPVYVPVYQTHVRGRRDAGSAVVDTYVPFQSGRPAVRPVEEPKPVYWGFGGKLRPDAWGQPADRGKEKPAEGEKDRPKK